MSDIDRLELKQRELRYHAQSYEKNLSSLNLRLRDTKNELLHAKKTWVEVLHASNKKISALPLKARSFFLEKTNEQVKVAKTKQSLQKIKLDNLRTSVEKNSAALRKTKTSLEHVDTLLGKALRVIRHKTEVSDFEDIHDSALCKSLLADSIHKKELDRKDSASKELSGAENILPFVEQSAATPVPPQSELQPSLAVAPPDQWFNQSVSQQEDGNFSSDRQGQPADKQSYQHNDASQYHQDFAVDSTAALSGVEVLTVNGEVSLSALYRSPNGTQVAISVSQTKNKSVNIVVGGQEKPTANYKQTTNIRQENLLRSLTHAGIGVNSLSIKNNEAS